MRPDSSEEKLAKLKPVFGKRDAEAHGTEATMTAGNSTPLTDGASAVLLASEEWAKENKLPVRAYLVDSETAAVDFIHGHDGRTPDGLLMAPTYAVPRLLERNGLTLQDFDFYEIHEAFASQVLATLSPPGSPTSTAPSVRPGLRAGLDRPQQAQRQRLLAGGRPPLRRDRWSHPRRHRQAAGAEGSGPRAHLHLRRRRPGVTAIIER